MTDTPATFPTTSTLAEAFDLVKDEILAVRPEALIPVNVHIPHAVRITLAAAERIAPLLPELGQLYDFDLRTVRRLRLYAAAALHTHLRAMDPPPADPHLRGLLEEATQVRTSLLLAAETLGHFGRIPAAQVVRLRRGIGHANTADDLSALAQLFESCWSIVRNEVPVDRAMIDRAAVLGMELQVALGARQLGRAPEDTSPDFRAMRDRAFTLLVHSYDCCRRGVAYLRWHHGDAHQYLPSIYTRRRRRSAKARPEEATTVDEGKTEDAITTQAAPDGDGTDRRAPPPSLVLIHEASPPR